MSVLIVGCGVMGLSTALELSNKGYEVTALDAYPVPSPQSAACDFNKIIRNEYSDVAYTKLAVEAYEMWKYDDLYKPAYSECGRILVTPELHQGRKRFEALGIANLKSIKGHGTKIEYFHGGEALANRFKHFKSNSVCAETEMKWNPEGGLGYAARSLRIVYNAAKAKGVNFIFGDKGNAVDIIQIGNKNYVVTKDGSKYTADKIVIASGAGSGRLLDLKQQQSATGLFVSHIKLTDKEYEFYKDIPVVFDSVLGYFFPPDPITKILKICLPGSGAQNMITSKFRNEKRSLPRYKVDHPEDTMPTEGVAMVRKLLGLYVPELKNHKLFDHKACWIADTSDSHFIIDKVPYLSNVYAATGDSGHAYKFLPNIGKYIVQKLEGTLDPELESHWLWCEDKEGFDATKSDWRVVTDNLDFSEIKWSKETDSTQEYKL